MVMTLPEQVIAVDPGKTTGLASWVRYGNESEGALRTVAELEFFPLCEFISGALRPGVRSVVVVERFIINAMTARNTQAPWSLEVIGALRLICHRTGVEFDDRQTPQQAKTFSTDYRLRAIGWYREGKVHGRDATRHLLLWLVRNGWRDDRLLLTSAI